MHKTRSYFHILCLLLFLSSATVPSRGQSVPTGIVFHKETIWRSNGYGDNWGITWGPNDQITSMDDGDWLNYGTVYHNHLYRIVGGADDFIRKDMPAYPAFTLDRSWFGYGMISVGGVLYSAVSKTPLNYWSGPFRGIKLLQSPDDGATWYRVNRRGELRLLKPDDPACDQVSAEEMFFLEEGGQVHEQKQGYPFSYVNFLQQGSDNSQARDGYVYIYSPEGAHSNQLLLARAPKERLGERAAWEYFLGSDGDKATWTHDLAHRGHIMEFPAKNAEGNYFFGWYSWLPSVVWNQGLGLYIMVNGGTYGGYGMNASDSDYYSGWMHSNSGSLGFWYAKNPWGPWKQIFYTDYWTVDHPDNRTYQPKLSPKWISGDGKDMVLIWSDAMKDREGRSHSVNYRWNQIKVTIQTR
jgi:hypothetical protein